MTVSSFSAAFCPVDFVKLEGVGSCYKIISDNASKKGYDAAEEMCQTYSEYAHLVTIDNHRERIFLSDLLSKEPGESSPLTTTGRGSSLVICSVKNQVSCHH